MCVWCVCWWRWMELGGYSMFFCLACSAVCVMAREADRETACVNGDGVSTRSLSASLPCGDSVCVCPLACPSECIALNILCVLPCFGACAEIQHALLGVPLCGSVCVHALRLLSSWGKASGHIGSCDRQPYLSADCIIGILGRRWQSGRGWEGRGRMERG